MLVGKEQQHDIDGRYIKTHDRGAFFGVLSHFSTSIFNSAVIAFEQLVVMFAKEDSL